jgi:hypothetical protein
VRGQVCSTPRPGAKFGYYQRAGLRLKARAAPSIRRRRPHIISNSLRTFLRGELMKRVLTLLLLAVALCAAAPPARAQEADGALADFARAIEVDPQYAEA